MSGAASEPSLLRECPLELKVSARPALQGKWNELRPTLVPAA